MHGGVEGRSAKEELGQSQDVKRNENHEKEMEII